MSKGDLSIQYGWLVYEAGEHTCAGGTPESGGAHEPGCGFLPELDLTTLDGWPRADAHTAAIAERAREWRAALDAVQAEEIDALALLEVTEEALAAAVDAEREAQSSARPDPQP